MKTRKWNTVNFPDWALCLAEYGEENNINEDDKEAFQAWKKKVERDARDGAKKHPISILYSWGEGSYFSQSPAFGLPCNCTQAEILITY